MGVLRENTDGKEEQEVGPGGGRDGQQRHRNKDLSGLHGEPQPGRQSNEEMKQWMTAVLKRGCDFGQGDYFQPK